MLFLLIIFLLSLSSITYCSELDVNLNRMEADQLVPDIIPLEIESDQPPVVEILPSKKDSRHKKPLALNKELRKKFKKLNVAFKRYKALSQIPDTAFVAPQPRTPRAPVEQLLALPAQPQQPLPVEHPSTPIISSDSKPREPRVVCGYCGKIILTNGILRKGAPEFRQHRLVCPQKR